MLDLSSKSLGLWAGLGTAAFLGYCIYFDNRRRSHPDFRRKLREKRKAASKGGSSSGPALPDFGDQEAVQRFFLQVHFFNDLIKSCLVKLKIQFKFVKHCDPKKCQNVEVYRFFT